MTDEGSRARRVETPGDQPGGKRPDAGRRPPAGTPSDEPAAGAGEAADKELLCTICGLRACWQQPDAGRANAESADPV